MATIVADDYSPISQGATGSAFNPQFLHLDGSAVNLAGATITMIMVDAEGNVKAAEGTFTINDATNGLTSYAYADSDVAVAGNWTLYIVITIAGKVVHVDRKPLEIEAFPIVG